MPSSCSSSENSPRTYVPPALRRSILILLQIGLEFSYAHVFAPPSSIPVTLRSLTFERAATLFNLAALYSQLAASEDRSTPDGLKRATLHYQVCSDSPVTSSPTQPCPKNAAGTFTFLRTAALPKLSIPPDAEESPLDLTVPFVHSLESLMLAQAQECAWQRAVAGARYVSRPQICPQPSC